MVSTTPRWYSGRTLTDANNSIAPRVTNTPTNPNMTSSVDRFRTDYGFNDGLRSQTTRLWRCLRKELVQVILTSNRRYRQHEALTADDAHPRPGRQRGVAVHAPAFAAHDRP